jgi:hypothetical protein
MSTLTSSATFTIGAGAVVIESTAVTILPAIGGATGRGRLIHPTLGTLDYPNAPDEWVNIDGDLIVAPIWSSTKTLQGAANALWQGNIRDVQVAECWIQELNVTIAFLRQLLAFFQNPPDPDAGTPVQWWPNYASALGFEVAMIDVSVSGDSGAQGIVLDALANRTGWVDGKVTNTMRILGRV